MKVLLALLSEKSTEAQTWLNMNHTKVTNPKKAAAAAEQQAERQAKKRKQYEAKIDALLEKRAKQQQ